MRAPSRTIDRARRLRRQLTLPEVLLWEALRGNRLGGHRFRRQHPIGPYILDFFCADERVAIEVDGASHGQPNAIEHDDERDAWLSGHGITVLRFPAIDVLSALRRVDVLETILAACAPSTAFGGPPPPRRGGGS